MANTKVKPGQHKAQYRIPLELAGWLKNRAEVNMRTINSELSMILREVRQREEKESANAT